MKKINISNWKRKEHFGFFKNFEYPFFDICFDIEITDLYNFSKKNNLKIFDYTIYKITQIINKIPEFKQRIHNEEVVEYESVNPSFTDILNKDNLFTYCTVEYDDDMNLFFERIKLKRNQNKKNIGLNLQDENNRDDLLFLTCIPWIQFKFLQHPIINFNSNNSIPIISWGKFYTNSDKIFMPISIHAHHSLVDGYHIKIFKDLWME